MPVFTANEIAGFARQAGVPDDKLPAIVAIAFAESSGNSDSIGYNTNGSSDVGLWQINSVHRQANPTWTESWLRNPNNNATAMASLSNKGSNLQPWDASKPVWSAAIAVKSDGKGGINWGQDEPNIVKDARNGLGKFIKKSLGYSTADALSDVGLDTSNVPVLGPALDAIDNTEKATIATAKLAVKGTEWIANPHNWLRVGFVILGAGTVLVGLAKLIGYDTGLVNAVKPGLPTFSSAKPAPQPRASMAKAKPDTPDYDTFVTV